MHYFCNVLLLFTFLFLIRRLLNTLNRNFDLCIPRKGIARPQSQFPHSCVCERSTDRSTYFPAAEQTDQLWEYINRSQKHVCRNWDCGRTALFWEYLFRIFGICLCSADQPDTMYFNTRKKGFKMLTFVKWIMVGHLQYTLLHVHYLVLCNTKLKTSDFKQILAPILI